jgi:hypothetical protein
MVTTQGKDRPGDAPEPPLPGRKSAAQSAELGAAVPNASSRSASQLKALTDLDEPDFAYRRAPQLPALAELPKELASLPPMAADGDASSEALEQSDFRPVTGKTALGAEDALALDFQRSSTGEQSAVRNDVAEVASGADAGQLQVRTVLEPDVATRVHTHVAPQARFDVTLAVSAPIDPRQRLAWRFDAACAAYKLLLPTAPTPEARAVMVNVLLRYEKLLRSSAASNRERTARDNENPHAQLLERHVPELDLCMSEVEGALLTLDECLPNDQFEQRFSKQHVPPKQLLQYARFLASRDFGIGYPRDRFEMLAQELLTAKLASGRLRMMSRKRASGVLLQLVRGLTRTAVSEEAQSAQVAYLCGALDRLQSLTGSKPFFDSGFYMDVYGYKISMHERITSPEFLYLCVAINVELHNRLHAWSQPSAGSGKRNSSGSLAALQVQLRAQHEAAQAVFPDFHRPIGAAAESGRAAKKAKRGKDWGLSGSSLVRFVAAALFVLAALGANLYTFGVVQLERPPEMLSADRLRDLSPLLINGRLTAGGKHFAGLVARPSWNRLTPRQRETAAESLAQALKAQGIDHAEVNAYKARAIQVDFGSVVFVDGGK